MLEEPEMGNPKLDLQAPDQQLHLLQAKTAGTKQAGEAKQPSSKMAMEAARLRRMHDGGGEEEMAKRRAVEDGREGGGHPLPLGQPWRPPRGGFPIASL